MRLQVIKLNFSKFWGWRSETQVSAGWTPGGCADLAMLLFQLMEMVVLRASSLIIRHSASRLPPHTVFSPMCLFVPVSKFLFSYLCASHTIAGHPISEWASFEICSIFKDPVFQQQQQQNHINCCQGLRIQHLLWGWGRIQCRWTLLIGMIPQAAIETHISGVHCPWSVFWNTFETCQSSAEMFERGVELRIFITTSASRIPQSNL